ncbi:ScbR family autoregulator-binding transcription factor [Compostimonas suwonensis]|uniref:AcrR family transcriptional regulator n=1 Tax=Compostimonas suwonensis TaxID=1048394 RepID=A0A2M9C084_9MICO|nr:ScbR family autoregulator-binding transcription factor [Compostimonas suwonensis]PJJ63724.1 AcrR family transcriptional regulator [Compostimonas suwonensis]
MLKQARAFETRETIVRAAGLVFSQLSYSTAKLSDIIQESGVTQGALYFHFESKRDLALEVIRRQHEISLGSGEEFLRSDVPGIEGLVLLSRELATQLTTNPIVRAGLRLGTESSNFFPEFARGPYVDWINTSEKFLHKAVAEGDVLPATNVPDVANFVIEAFTGAQMVSQVISEWADLSDRLVRMWELVLNGIVVPERREKYAALPERVRLDVVTAR